MEGKRTRFFYFHFRGCRWKIFKMYNVGHQGSVIGIWSKAIYQNWFFLEVVSRRFYNVTWCLRAPDFFQPIPACCRIVQFQKCRRCLIIFLFFAKENPQLHGQLFEKKSMGGEMSFWPLVRPRCSLLPWRLRPCCSKSTNPSIFVILLFSVFPVCFFAYVSLLCFISSFLLLPLLRIPCYVHDFISWEKCAGRRK